MGEDVRAVCWYLNWIWGHPIAPIGCLCVFMAAHKGKCTNRYDDTKYKYGHCPRVMLPDSHVQHYLMLVLLLAFT